MCLGIQVFPLEYSVLEDLDADGNVDHAVRALARGTVVVGIDSLGSDGFSGMAFDMKDSVFGDFGATRSNTIEHIISATKPAGGFYTWTVTVRDTITGHVYGIYGRNASNQLFCIVYDKMPEPRTVQQVEQPRSLVRDRRSVHIKKWTAPRMTTLLLALPAQSIQPTTLPPVSPVTTGVEGPSIK
jgi:hypothetical protein